MVPARCSGPTGPQNTSLCPAVSVVRTTMGGGDSCPVFPGRSRSPDGKLDDPAGQGVDAVRPVRDENKARVEDLIAGIVAARTA